MACCRDCCTPCCKQCTVKTKREFHWTRLLLRHRDWRTVAYSPWLPYNAWQVIHIAWRWILVYFFFAWLVVSGVEWSHPTYFIYLTNWGMLTWVLYLIVSALSCTVKFTFDMYARIKGNNSVNTEVELAERKDVESGNTATEQSNVDEDIYANWRTDNVAWYQKIHWVLYNTSIPLEIGIAILYWALLYNPAVVIGSAGVNFNTHLTPALIALLDVWISSILLNIYHFYMILLYGVVYGAFSLIYFAAGGMDQEGNRYIYSILDYGDSPGLAAGVLLGSVFVFFPFCYVLCYLITLPRRWLSSKFHQLCYITLPKRWPSNKHLQSCFKEQ